MRSPATSIGSVVAAPATAPVSQHRGDGAQNIRRHALLCLSSHSCCSHGRRVQVGSCSWERHCHRHCCDHAWHSQLMHRQAAQLPVRRLHQSRGQASWPACSTSLHPGCPHCCRGHQNVAVRPRMDVCCCRSRAVACGGSQRDAGANSGWRLVPLVCTVCGACAHIRWCGVAQRCSCRSRHGHVLMQRWFVCANTRPGIYASLLFLLLLLLLPLLVTVLLLRLLALPTLCCIPGCAPACSHGSGISALLMLTCCSSMCWGSVGETAHPTGPSHLRHSGTCSPVVQVSV